MMSSLLMIKSVHTSSMAVPKTTVIASLLTSYMTATGKTLIMMKTMARAMALTEKTTTMIKPTNIIKRTNIMISLITKTMIIVLRQTSRMMLMITAVKMSIT